MAAPNSNGSQVDSNQSIVTATDKEANTSVPTSPIILKEIDYDKKFNDLVVSKSLELISIMKDINDNIKINENEIKIDEKPENFDWKVIIENSESIFNEYTKKMEDVTKEFEDLNRVLFTFNISLN